MKTLYREWRIFYYTWALGSINALHTDVPFIVRRLNELIRHRNASLNQRN